MEKSRSSLQRVSVFFKGRMAEVILFFVAAILFPNIFFFYLYNQNRVEVWSSFGTIVLFAAFFATISALVLLVLRLLVGSFEGALLVLIPCWLSFWWFNPILSGFAALQRNFPFIRLRILFAGLFILMVALMLFLRLRKASFQKRNFIFKWVSFVISLLFLYNFLLSVSTIGLGSERTLVEIDTEREYLIQREFVIERELPSPDIFWLMPDGMISFVDYETYFEDSQDLFREFLEERGFAIYEDGRSVGTNTYTSLPTLLSPSYYDHIFGPIVAQLEDVTCPRVFQDYTVDMLWSNNINLHLDIVPHWELFLGFMAADYTAVHIAPHGGIYQVTDLFYRLPCYGVDLVELHFMERNPFTTASEQGQTFEFLTQNASLINLLRMSTPLGHVIPSVCSHYYWQPVPDHMEAVEGLVENTRGIPPERELYRFVIDVQDIPGPKIVYVALEFTHPIGWPWFPAHIEDSALEQNPLGRYQPAHEYSVLVMMNIIDVILESNPNAVIVIQADHGIHNPGFHVDLLEFGYTEEDIMRLNFSVMSAKRIPPEYGGIEAPIAPLNITRELINRFVGENYELIPSE